MKEDFTAKDTKVAKSPVRFGERLRETQKALLPAALGICLPRSGLGVLGDLCGEKTSIDYRDAGGQDFNAENAEVSLRARRYSAFLRAPCVEDLDFVIPPGRISRLFPTRRIVGAGLGYQEIDRLICQAERHCRTRRVSKHGSGQCARVRELTVIRYQRRPQPRRPPAYARMTSRDG